MKVNWETRGNKLLRHVHTDWLQTCQEIFRRTTKCVRISDLWDKTRNLQRAKHENYNKKRNITSIQEYYVKQEYYTKQEYYIKHECYIKTGTAQ